MLSEVLLNVNIALHAFNHFEVHMGISECLRSCRNGGCYIVLIYF